jgi:hypothetical protein
MRGLPRDDVLDTTGEVAAHGAGAPSELHHKCAFRQEGRRFAPGPTISARLICLMPLIHGGTITQTGTSDLKDILQSF